MCWHVDEDGTPCGHAIESQSATHIINQILAMDEGTRLMLLAPVIRGKKGNHKEIFDTLIKQGFVRARVNGAVVDLRQAGGDTEDAAVMKLDRYKAHNIEAVVDRIVIKNLAEDKDNEVRSRVADSVELALKTSEGLIVVSELVDRAKDEWGDTLYSEKYACPNHPESSLEDLEPRLFSFNSPYGACAKCSGLGIVLEFDEDLIVPDQEKSIAEGAIEVWRGGGRRNNIYYGKLLKKFCKYFEVDNTTPFKKLTKSIRRI